MYDEVHGLAERFARAASERDLRNVIGDATLLLRSRVSEADQVHVARIATRAANYSYLLGHPDIAASLLRETDERCRNPQSALLVLTGWHRLYRNLYATGDLVRTRIRLARLLRKQEHGQWDRLEARVEMAHLARYRGRWAAALDTYRNALATLAPKHPYRALLVAHFIFSLLCDAFEIAVVGLRFGHKEDTLSQLESTLQLFPEATAVGPYPMLQALYAKHRALCSAGLGERGKALAHAQLAHTLMTRLGSKKGRLLCDEFSALVEFATGSTASALGMLERAAAEAEGYYPRLVFRAKIHSARFRLLEATANLSDVAGAPTIHSRFDRGFAIALQGEMVAAGIMRGPA